MPLPAKVTQLKPTPQADGSHGAIYRKKQAAILAKTGQPKKRTDYYAVDIIDSSGVEAFSSFQIEFDPVYESLFVNSLKIFDSSQPAE